MSFAPYPDPYLDPESASSPPPPRRPAAHAPSAPPAWSPLGAGAEPPDAGLPYVPGAEAPPTREFPPFDPVRVRGARTGLDRLVRHRRRAVAAGLAVTAAALVAAGPGDSGADRTRGHPADPAQHRASAATTDRPVRTGRASSQVRAPVRIADAATVRLLRPGDRIDVIATTGGTADGPALDGAGRTAGEAAAEAGDTSTRVIARGARVARVPEILDDDPAGGALVVLSVSPATAARLAGADATARLAVTLW